MRPAALPPSSTRRLQRTSGSSPSMQGASGAGVGAARRLQVQNAALTSRSDTRTPIPSHRGDVGSRARRDTRGSGVGDRRQRATSEELTHVDGDGSRDDRRHAHAEQALSGLRASRDDAWLTEIAVLEHHRGGRYSMKATTPEYGEKGHVGAGATVGGLTGLALGAIAGALGLVFWGTMGAMTGGVARRHWQPAVRSIRWWSRSRTRCRATARRSSWWRSPPPPRSSSPPPERTTR